MSIPISARRMSRLKHRPTVCFVLTATPKKKSQKPSLQPEKGGPDRRVGRRVSPFGDHHRGRGRKWFRRNANGWRAARDDSRTFLSEFMPILPQTGTLVGGMRYCTSVRTELP